MLRSASKIKTKLKKFKAAFVSLKKATVDFLIYIIHKNFVMSSQNTKSKGEHFCRYHNMVDELVKAPDLQLFFW